MQESSNLTPVNRSLPVQRFGAGLLPLQTRGAILLQTLDEERSIAPVLEEICESIDVLAR